MPVSIEHKGSGILIDTLAVKVGLAHAGAALKDKGCTLAVKPKHLTIAAPDGSTVAAVQLNANVLPMYMAGETAKMTKDHIESQLITLYQHAAKAMGVPLVASLSTPYGVSLDPAVQPPVGKAKPGLLKPAAVASAPKAGGVSLSAPVVPLASATAIHTPVHGSSSNSRYFVVALGPVNIAARLRMAEGTWGLSVRAEGAALPQYAHHLQAVGLTPHDGYMSMHIDNGAMPPTEQMLLRALGSVLGGLGIPFTEVAFGNNVLINKGS